ncbi:MAG: DUF4143 domain-containing protein [Candidatus Sulfotelmatobacter sp.]
MVQLCSGAICETFIFAQLRECERRAGNVGSVFFWRDRTREVDFLVRGRRPFGAVRGQSGLKCRRPAMR